MNDLTGRCWKSSGFRRVAYALKNQFVGMRRGLLYDPAIREVSITCIALSIGALFVPVSRIERLLLVLPLLLVMLLEYLNSAIEAVVDRISMEPHLLSKDAKDFSSIAVGLAMLMALLCWIVIAVPVLGEWIHHLL